MTLRKASGLARPPTQALKMVFGAPSRLRIPFSLPPPLPVTTVRATDGLTSQRSRARPDKTTPSPARPEEGDPPMSRTTHSEMRGSDPSGMLPAGLFLYSRAPCPRPPEYSLSGVMTAPRAP